MPDSLSDRLRSIGVRAVAASGVVLPETVPRDGTDAYEGSIRRAFLVGLARDLRRGGLGVDEIVDAMRLRYAGLPDWEIFNAVRA